MKKLFPLLMAFCLMFALTNCAGGSPKSAANEVYTKLKKGDYKGVAKMYVDKDGNSLTNSEAEILASWIELAASQIADSGIKSFEIVDNTKRGDHVIVEFKVKYKNGEEGYDELDMIKAKDGKWHPYFDISADDISGLEDLDAEELLDLLELEDDY